MRIFFDCEKLYPFVEWDDDPELARDGDYTTELSEAEFADLLEVTERWEAWQNRLFDEIVAVEGLDE